MKGPIRAPTIMRWIDMAAQSFLALAEQELSAYWGLEILQRTRDDYVACVGWKDRCSMVTLVFPVGPL